MIILAVKNCYARTVHNQKDYQYDWYELRTTWQDTNEAIGHVNGTYAKGLYTNNKGKIKKPHTLSAYDFEADIPSNALITKIAFEVRMRKVSTGKKAFKVKAPTGVFQEWHTKTKDTSDGMSTGWRVGGWRYNPNQELSSSWETYEYRLTGDNLKTFINKKGINRTPAERINTDRFGILFYNQDAEMTGEIHIAWVRLVVTYRMPQPYISYTNVSRDVNKPTNAEIGRVITINGVFGNNSANSMDNQDLEVILPYGFKLVEMPKISGASISFDMNTMTWRVSGKAKSESKIQLKCTASANRAKSINIGNSDIGYSTGYFWIFGNAPDDYAEGFIVYSTLQQGEISCVSSTMTWVSQDNIAEPYLELGDLDILPSDIVSVEVNSANEGVALIDYTIHGSRITARVHVPSEEEVELILDVCYYPRKAGTITIRNNFTYEDAYVLEAAEKHIIFNTDNDGECTNVYRLECNRVFSQVDTDTMVIPIRFDDYSSDIIVDEPTFKIDQWKKRKYIGCLEVQQSHFEPESTFEDDLLYEHYKNNEYVGKANEYEEDISLQIRLPPKAVPTVQGMIKIDKPIPINLVPTAWEGDPLNHRGWVEIYKIKAEQTNPLWDKCDIDVKYITHNIISRFNIYHGGALNPDFSLPSVYNNTLDTGDDIGEFFNVTTDGSYIYDDTDINTRRNIFSINNQQFIELKSKAPISTKSKVDFYWDTTLFDEYRENNIQRVIQLVDEWDTVIFEYEYYNFNFNDTVYSCSVQGRALDDSYNLNSVFNKSEVYIHSDVEYTKDKNDEDYDDEDIDVYGSRVSFSLDSSRLTVQEHGFSDNEFTETVNLMPGNYYLKVLIKNTNNDADTGNVLNWFDCEISEMINTSAVSDYYNKLLVSPYPVPHKKIVFTRECSEGTLYYLENDGTDDYNFLLEPFYQYLCGVDLVNDEDYSVFDFNNSYSVIYLSNCLIRIGINRLNGDLYLDKWDTDSKQYIRTNRFRISKFDDADVTYISDDEITVKISDIYITMYRGRPYVVLSHETEDIQILDTFNQVFADGLNDEIWDYPRYWNLINSQNLLPECIGGTKLIKSSCIDLTIDETPVTEVEEFIITASKTNCELGEDVICTIMGLDVEDGEVSLVIQTEDEKGISSEVIGTNIGNKITGTLDKDGLATIYAVYHGTETRDVKISNLQNVLVRGNHAEEGSSEQGHYILFPEFPAKLTYNQGEFNFGLSYIIGTEGEGEGYPVEGVAVDIYTMAQTWHEMTNEHGSTVGAKNKGIEAGSHQPIWAEAWDDGKLLARWKGSVEIVKDTPVIKGSTLSLKKGNKAGWRVVDSAGDPIEGIEVDIDINGTKYVRKTSLVSKNTGGGYVGVKMSSKGTYQAKVKFIGVNLKYKAVEKEFTIEVK